MAKRNHAGSTTAAVESIGRYLETRTDIPKEVAAMFRSMYARELRSRAEWKTEVDATLRRTVQ